MVQVWGVSGRAQGPTRKGNIVSVETIAATLKAHATSAIDAESAARLRLAERATNVDAELSSFIYADAVQAAGQAAPWRELLTLAEQKGTMRDAVATARRRALRSLLEYGESQSTSAITNEIERCKREGLRSFLSYTEWTLESFDEAASEEPPAAPEITEAEVTEEAPDTLLTVFATVDRSYEPGSVTELVFMHNGGRSKYQVQPITGRPILLAPVINKNIITDLITAATAHAKATYGPRRAWPARMILNRPATPSNTV